MGARRRRAKALRRRAPPRLLSFPTHTLSRSLTCSLSLSHSLSPSRVPSHSRSVAVLWTLPHTQETTGYTEYSQEPALQKLQQDISDRDDQIRLLQQVRHVCYRVLRCAPLCSSVLQCVAVLHLLRVTKRVRERARTTQREHARDRESAHDTDASDIC